MVGVDAPPAFGLNTIAVLWSVVADGARQRGTVREEPSEDQEGAVSRERGAAERRRPQVNRGSCPTLMADQGKKKKKVFF